MKRYMTSISAQTVANTILFYAFNDGISITPMKLQRLMYLLYREFARSTDAMLFSDQFEMWQYGPVLSGIYYVFEKFRSERINKFARNTHGDVTIMDLTSNVELKRCWDYVWHRYCNRSGIELSRITRRPGSAWSKAAARNSFVLAFDDIVNDREY